MIVVRSSHNSDCGKPEDVVHVRSFKTIPSYVPINGTLEIELGLLVDRQIDGPIQGLLIDVDL